ncbi:Ribonuclease Y [bacterium HR36]|nr:Ribonuclease Y [bacterium HR36]
MTLIGRIFAILNFFMALVFLGFAFSAMSLIKDPKSGRSWYEVAEGWKKQAASLENDLKARDDHISQLADDLRKTKERLDVIDKEKDKLLQQERTARAQAEKRADDVENKFKESQVRLQQLTAELDQKQKELVALNQQLTRALAEVQEQLRKTELERVRRVEQEQARNVLQDRVRQLMEEVTRLQRELESERRQGLAVEPKAGVVVPRPPAHNVRGQILRIGGNGLIEISIGGDAGLMKNHTLEVFRLEPQPAYIGRVVVLEVEPHRAVAQFINREQAKQARVGDQVASRVIAAP